MRSTNSLVLIAIFSTCAVGRTYTTTFPAAENPISESGMWLNGKADATNWTNVRTTAHYAFGTQTGGGYDDSTAILTGTWADTQTATATIAIVSASGTDNVFEEAEVRLRTHMSKTGGAGTPCAGGTPCLWGYEINCSVNTNALDRYIQIIRWNGPLNNFTQLYGNSSVPTCVTGDTLTATISGGTITVYRNGTLIGSATDGSPITGGSPGIGFYGAFAADLSNYGFSAFTATDQVTHWVSPTGAATWANCANPFALSGSSACALATANSNAAAGDVVYLRTGTYSTSLAPTHSGTCASTCLGGVGASIITFSAYTGEAPTIAVSTFGLSLSSVSWIKVTGITFRNVQTYPFYFYGASYNEVSYCSFVNVSPSYATSSAQIGAEFAGSPPWSTHNYLHNNYISRAINTDPCGEAVDLVQIGGNEGSCSSGTCTGVSQDDYNTIDNNYLEYGGHGTLMPSSKHNVLRSNIVHNEPFITGCTSTGTNDPTYDNAAYNGLYGHRNVQTSDADPDDPNYQLLEGNRIGFASPNPNNGGSSNIDVSSPRNIIRYNFIYAGMNSGIYFKYAASDGAGTGGSNNKVYNNTIYANGKGWNAGVYGHGNLNYNGEGIAQFTYGGLQTNNVVKNNIVYGNGYSGQWDICYLGWYPSANCSADSIDTVSNNWLTSNGDPKFTNPALTDPTSQNLFPSVHGYASTPIPDLSLQSNSPAINGGTYLTTASGTGTNSTSLVVADAWYFQDGTWGSDLARGVTLFPDWIAIGTVGNTVQISSINYATNTITLATAKSWSNNAPIWLYKKSDGSVVLNGTAPDYGAAESSGSSSAVTQIHGAKAQGVKIP